VIASPPFGPADVGPAITAATARPAVATPSKTSALRDGTVDVIGAGPAGLACAIVLAHAGRRVVVHEARARVGARFHGDFQGLENWSSDEDVLAELARAGIGTGFDHHPVRRGMAFDAWGQAYAVAGEEPIYYLVRRGPDAGTLDQAFLDQARTLGVEVRLNERVRQASGVAVLAGGPRAADAIAVGYVFETGMPDGNYICFDEAIAPGGYAYLLLHQGRGTVATCLFTGFKRKAHYLARTVAMFRERVGLSMDNPRRFGGYANFRLPRTAVQGGHPVVGEYAGFQDALAGFGMRYALRSGVLAARSLIEGADYETLWRRELQPELRASVANRFLFNLAGDRGWRWMLARRLSRGDVRKPLRRLYRPSLSKTLVFPLARWRYRAPLRDPSCDHVACDCVRCRHGIDQEDAAPRPCQSKLA
jgi:flavin-dependent dehydrogenase